MSSTTVQRTEFDCMLQYKNCKLDPRYFFRFMNVKNNSPMNKITVIGHKLVFNFVEVWL